MAPQRGHSYSLLAIAVAFSFAMWMTAGCKGCGGEKPEPPPSDTTIFERLSPEFNADSAYRYVEKQVSFGPRVPNTPAHDSCAKWLLARLESFGLKIYEQKAQVKAWDGKELRITNIVGSYNPKAARRIMLFAHWDTRPWADRDVIDDDKPIDGANDGASGVGVLLEIARQLQHAGLNIGVDIIFFDAEDYGKSRHPNSFCLGSQYWAKNRHKPNYNAAYGILLDMVGAHNARFPMEGYSMQFAPSLVRKVWTIAANLGYANYFIFETANAIEDDHYYITTMAGIPSIDIIHLDRATTTGFAEHWHTHDDDIEIISKQTLKAVGQTVLEVIYQENQQPLL